MAGEVFDWLASPGPIGFHWIHWIFLILLDFLWFRQCQKWGHFFFDNWISVGPKWKINLFGKGSSKMIAIAQFLVLWKDMLLYLCIEHIFWRRGAKGGKIMGADTYLHRPSNNPRRKTLSLAWAPPTPMKLLPCSLKEVQRAKRPETWSSESLEVWDLRSEVWAWERPELKWGWSTK